MSSTFILLFNQKRVDTATLTELPLVTPVHTVTFQTVTLWFYHHDSSPLACRADKETPALAPCQGSSPAGTGGKENRSHASL